jgi:two-component system nitrate/nitrite response regulator NarL
MAFKKPTTTELNKRELGVLQKIADGKLTKEIALDYHLTYDTILRNARTLMVKLGAKNRAEAVYIALRKGIIR